MVDGRVLVLLAAVCFGTTGTAQALGVPGAEPATVGAARIAVGALGLLVAARVLDGRRRPRRDRLPLLAVGALGVAAYQPAFFLAVHLTGVGVGTVVALGTAPVLTGLAAHLTGAGRIDAGWALGTGLAAAGLAVLVVTGRSGTDVDVGGVVLAMVAAASYATYTLTSKRLLDDGLPAATTMAWTFAPAAVLLLPVFGVLPGGWLLTGRGAAQGLFLGLVPTALAYLLFARGLARTTPARAATLTLAEPLTAVLLGILLLGERPGPGALAGAGLLVAGLAAAGVRGRPADHDPSEKAVLEDRLFGGIMKPGPR
jgi:DME family drug/metabolite transporter